MDLSGKTAIVTGGGRDIGRACVLALAKAGANVAINYFSSSSGADSAVEPRRRLLLAGAAQIGRAHV